MILIQSICWNIIMWVHIVFYEENSILESIQYFITHLFKKYSNQDWKFSNSNEIDKYFLSYGIACLGGRATVDLVLPPVTEGG